MKKTNEERSKIVLAVEKLLPAYLSKSVTDLELSTIAEELTYMLPDKVLDEYYASGEEDVLDDAIPGLLTLAMEKKRRLK